VSPSFVGPKVAGVPPLGLKLTESSTPLSSSVRATARPAFAGGVTVITVLPAPLSVTVFVAYRPPPLRVITISAVPASETVSVRRTRPLRSRWALVTVKWLLGAVVEGAPALIVRVALAPPANV